MMLQQQNASHITVAHEYTPLSSLQPSFLLGKSHLYIYGYLCAGAMQMKMKKLLAMKVIFTANEIASSYISVTYVGYCYFIQNIISRFFANVVNLAIFAEIYWSLR